MTAKVLKFDTVLGGAKDVFDEFVHAIVLPLKVVRSLALGVECCKPSGHREHNVTDLCFLA